jgi:hypothetical protein
MQIQALLVETIQRLGLAEPPWFVIGQQTGRRTER